MGFMGTRVAWSPCLTVVASMLAACAANGEEIRCSGEYGGHLQGIATDRSGAIFWSFTVDLVKTDMKGNVLAHVVVPTHHGDLTCHDGKVYVAVNLGKFNEEPGQADSWVYVYRADDLSLLSKHEVQDVVHGAGGVEYRDGKLFVVGGLPKGYEENYVYEYDADYKLMARHVIRSGYTHLGIQTAAFGGGRWWFGCYGDPRELILTDDSFGMLSKTEQDFSYGVAFLSDKEVLKGFTRQDAESKRWLGWASVETVEPTKQGTP